MIEFHLWRDAWSKAIIHYNPEVGQEYLKKMIYYLFKKIYLLQNYDARKGQVRIIYGNIFILVWHIIHDIIKILNEVS